MIQIQLYFSPCSPCLSETTLSFCFSTLLACLSASVSISLGSSHTMRGCYKSCWFSRNVGLEELPSSISNLRNLEILDLERSKVLGMVANVLWKLKHLKYLRLPRYFEVVEKLRFKGLDELEVMYNYNVRDTLDELIGLGKLKVLSGSFYMSDVDSDKYFLDFIKSRELRHSNLCIFCEDELNLVSWLECCFINVLRISGPICRLPKEYDPTRFFSSCLIYLSLNRCKLEEDPMVLLEKLPNLCKLDLDEDAYLGTEMVCTAQGFPKLETLWLSRLKGLKQWRVEQGAMPNLFSLIINSCSELEMLPEGLRYLAALEYLWIRNMPVAFMDRIKGIDGAEGIDMYKISHVRRVIV